MLFFLKLYIFMLLSLFGYVHPAERCAVLDPEVVIQEFNKKRDLHDVCKIARQSADGIGSSAVDDLENILGTDISRVARIGGKTVGFINYAVHHKKEMPEKTHGHIFFLAVREKGRSHGIGRLLLDVALSEMEKSGAVYTELKVYSDNTRAIKFYQSHGFVLADRPNAYRILRTMVFRRRGEGLMERFIHALLVSIKNLSTR